MSRLGAQRLRQNTEFRLKANMDLFETASPSVIEPVEISEPSSTSESNIASAVTLPVPTGRRAIEDDAFPFERLSAIAEHESWRKEVFRPVYHMHKWWAQRL